MINYICDFRISYDKTKYFEWFDDYD